jgi:hypothetical protein
VQEEAPLSPTSKIRRRQCPSIVLSACRPLLDPPHGRVEELAKPPEYLGVHEVTSASPVAIPGSPLVLGVELHLGTQSALLRCAGVPCHSEAALDSARACGVFQVGGCSLSDAKCREPP